MDLFTLRFKAAGFVSTQTYYLAGEFQLGTDNLNNKMIGNKFNDKVQS